MREKTIEPIENVPTDKIIPSAKQMRKVFDQKAIRRLAKSIRERGLLQPISVRKNKDGAYELVHGERRYRACKSLCWETIPAFVVKASDEDLLIDGLVENLLREDLKPIERSKGVLELFKSINPDKFKTPNNCCTLINCLRNWERRGEVPPPSDHNLHTTKEEVFKASDYMNMIGMAANTAVASLQVLNLPDDILERVIYTKNVQERMRVPKGTITFAMAYQLARLPPQNQKDMRAMYKYVLKQHSSLKRLTAMVDEYMVQHRNELNGTDLVFHVPRAGRQMNETCETLAKKIDQWRARLNVFRIRNLYHAGFLQQIDLKGSLKMLREELIAFKSKVDSLVLEVEEIENERLKEMKGAKGKVFEVEISTDARISIPAHISRAFGFAGLRADKRKKDVRKIRVVMNVLDMREVEDE